MSTEAIEDKASTESSGGEAHGSGSTLARIRLGVFYLLILVALAMTVAFLRELLPLIVLGWTPAVGAELGIHRLHVMGIAGVVAVILLGVFAQTYRPTARVAAMWGALVTMTVATVGTLAYGVGRPEEVVPFFVVIGLMTLIHPAGRDLLRRGSSYSPALLALVAVAALPLLAFLVNQFALTPNASDPHAVEGHYVMMAALAVTPLAYGTVAALGFAGWRLAAWFAALGPLYHGLMSVAFPAQSSSVGMMWGVAAIAWAVAFVLVAEYSRTATVGATFRRDVARAS
jgi:hypothetical protein